MSEVKATLADVIAFHQGRLKPAQFIFSVPGAMLLLERHYGLMTEEDVAKYATSLCGALEKAELKGYVVTTASGTVVTPLGTEYLATKKRKP